MGGPKNTSRATPDPGEAPGELGEDHHSQQCLLAG